MDQKIITWLRGRMDEPDVIMWVEEVLTTLCKLDTSISSDLSAVCDAEKRCFQICCDYLAEIGKVSFDFLPIDGAALKEHPDYTIPYYGGKLKDQPETVYKHRHNLLVSMGDNKSDKDARWILNAHLDTVSPHIPPRKLGDKSIGGRGTVDNKGGVVVAMLVCRLLHDAAKHGVIDKVPAIDLVLVIDEESGGNGALSALNHLSTTSGTVVVLEPTNLNPHPANRGALWFKLELSREPENPRESLLLAIAYCVKAIFDAGKTIRRTSRHPLFSQDDIQTCFGILGAFGNHPSSACTHLSIEARSRDNDFGISRIQELMASSFNQAMEKDEIAHKASNPRIRAHNDEPFWTVQFSSLGGHMGSKSRDSDAILKAAASIIIMDQRSSKLSFDLSGSPAKICLEGGQGFLPDASIETVKATLSHAVESAIRQYALRRGVDKNHVGYTLSFDKLHNRAYCCHPSPGASLLKDAIEELSGKPFPPPAGWQASCDARLFAKKFGDVVTFGAGKLEDAHQENECIHLPELITAAAAIVLAITTSNRTYHE